MRDVVNMDGGGACTRPSPFPFPRTRTMTEIVTRKSIPVRDGDNTPPPKRPRKILTISDLHRMRQEQREFIKNNPPVNPPPFPFNLEEYKETVTPVPLWSVVRQGAWKGRRCFVIGGGPSLKRFKWEKLAGELTIGVNRVFEKFLPTMIFCMDARVWGWLEQGRFGSRARERFKDFPGYKVWVDNSTYLFPPEERIYVVGGLEPHGGNSGHAAVNLAVKLGANPVYLLGFDMKGDGKGGQKWWHDGYPELQEEGVYEYYIRAFTDTAWRYRDAGVDVVNLTPRSALKCFPTDKFSNVVRTPKRKPLVVTYCTPGYRGLVDRWKRSVHRQGLEWYVEEIPDRGGWRENTRYKPTFMKQVIDRTGKDVVWLDVDGVACAYPDLFVDAKFDIGFVTVDWSKYSTVARNDVEALSGTVFVRNSRVGREFLTAWERELERDRELVDAVAMAVVSKRFRYESLPPTYCKIFDTMMDTPGEAVFEHFQASRVLRHGGAL